jgi:hypothetical protein
VLQYHQHAISATHLDPANAKTTAPFKNIKCLGTINSSRLFIDMLSSYRASFAEFSVLLVGVYKKVYLRGWRCK